MMTDDVKQKVKDSMLEHLKSMGYPDMDYDAIEAELPRLWDKLNDEGLLKDLIARGFTFEHFTDIALQKRFEYETMGEVMQFFNKKR